MELFVLCGLYFVLFAVVYTLAIVGVVMEVRRMEGITRQPRDAQQPAVAVRPAAYPAPTGGATPSHPAPVT